MGQQVGYLAREQAAKMTSPLMTACGGVLEVTGLIVGGWRNSENEGHYGIRVWMAERDVAASAFRQ
jgi:hypothetical protein